MIHLTDAPPRPARTFATPAWITREAFKALERQLVTVAPQPVIVLTDAAPEPVDIGAATVGDTVRVTLPERFR